MQPLPEGKISRHATDSIVLAMPTEQRNTCQGIARLARVVASIRVRELLVALRRRESPQSSSLQV